MDLYKLFLESGTRYTREIQSEFVKTFLGDSVYTGTVA